MDGLAAMRHSVVELNALRPIRQEGFVSRQLLRPVLLAAELETF